jgi:hypothetical protein
MNGIAHAAVEQVTKEGQRTHRSVHTVDDAHKNAEISQGMGQSVHVVISRMVIREISKNTL